MSGDTRVSEPGGGFDPLDDQECYGAENRRARDQFDVDEVGMTKTSHLNVLVVKV